MLKKTSSICFHVIIASLSGLCMAQSPSDAATSIATALVRYSTYNNPTEALRFLRRMDSHLAREGYKEVIQTTPTLFDNSLIIQRAVDDIIRHNGTHDVDLVQFLKTHENNPLVRGQIREALYGIIQGSDPQDALDAPETLRSPKSTALEKTQAIVRMQNHPELIRPNLDVVRELAITPSPEILARNAAVTGLIKADDWKWLISRYNETDDLGKKAIIKGLSEYVMSKGFPSSITNQEERDALAGIFQVAALENGDTVKQDAAVRALAYLVTRGDLETATKDEVSMDIVQTLKRVRSDAASRQARKMADQVLQQLPADVQK